MEDHKVMCAEMNCDWVGECPAVAECPQCGSRNLRRGQQPIEVLLSRIVEQVAQSYDQGQRGCAVYINIGRELGQAARECRGY